MDIGVGLFFFSYFNMVVIFYVGYILYMDFKSGVFSIDREVNYLLNKDFVFCFLYFIFMI